MAYQRFEWKLKVPRAPRLAAIRRAAALAGPGEGEVLIDDQTFRDLEVFEGQGSAPSLFQLLNRTATSGGAEALKRRFRHPLSDPARIAAVHASLEHIRQARSSFDALPVEGVLAGVRRHIHSNQGLVPADSPFEAGVEALQLRVTDPKRFRLTAQGVKRTRRMLHALGRFADRPELTDAPGELGIRLAEMRELLARPALVALSHEPEDPKWWRLLRVDRVLRHDERASIERLLQLVFELDALVSMADAIKEHKLVMPELRDGPAEVVGEGVRHLFLEAPVPNPIRLDQEKRLLFLTGPNMAGKTTYLRACGTAVYLAHLGMGVPAARFAFAPSDGIFSAITLTDNVRAGVSFFRAEALRVKAIAQAVAAGRSVFAILDEPFKGTNVKDALDATRAIFSRLAAVEGCLFLVSSHLIEVAAPLEETGNVACHRFEASERGGHLEFDFVLRPGVSAQRLGVRVLEEEGVFDLLPELPSEA